MTACCIEAELIKKFKIASGPAFDHLEKALHKFDDGPFFLGQFSLVSLLLNYIIFRVNTPPIFNETKLVIPYFQ